MDLTLSNVLSFMIGADEVIVKDNKAIIKFYQNSERYSVLREAIAFLNEFETCNANEENYMIDEIKKLYNYFDAVKKKAKENYNIGLEYVYCDEVQEVINKLEEKLIKKGKF